MATKFYLRAATQSTFGTLPAANVSVSATTPTKIASGVNMSAEIAKGSLQTSTILTTNNVTSAQSSLIGRFVSDPLTGGQVIGSQAINISIGGAEQNANSNLHVTFAIALWRPSTGASVGLITDLTATATLEPGTTETSLTGTTSVSTSQTTVNGDVLVFEVWRDATVQGASTAYSNTIFYDGTTEASTSTNAAFINFGTSTLTFLNNGFAQAQSDIKATSNGLAQGQADIKTTTPTFGQAQAGIKATSRGFGQAQASIKATSSAFAQAQSDIKATSSVFAQVQADIKVTSNGFAQSLSTTTKTSTGFAQAQAYIGTITLGLYGAPINMDGLGNTQVGGPNGVPGRLVALRFRAISSSLTAVRINIPNNSPGYYGGTGGSLRITIRPDDGTATHAPTSTILATYDITNLTATSGNPPGGTNYPLLTFSSPAALTTGQLYHVVVLNIDADPATNFVSLDSMWCGSVLSPRQPKYPDLDWAVLYKDSGAWHERGTGADTEQYTPSLALTYASGATDGIGYVFSDIGSPQSISDTTMVREAFTVSGGTRTVSDIRFRMKRVSGTSALTVRLEQSDGTLIEQGTLASGATSTTNVWFTYTFSGTKTLTNGAAYNVILSCPADTVYSIYAPYEGSIYGPWEANTYFADGKAQKSISGAAYTDWGSRTDHDFQFYFTSVTLNQDTFAQAQGYIKTISYSFAQSQVDIKATSRAFAQAQSDIKSTSSVSAQSQTDVKQTSNTFAQTQADIKSTSNVFAQSQSDIKSVGFVFAQAQVDIKSTLYVFAQSQADVKATTNSFAQSRVHILTTPLQSAQSQVTIKATNQGYAQVQAKINAFGVQAFAQSSTNIKGAGSLGPAQAQATVKTTVNSAAQSQVDIKTTGSDFGQVQADIKATNSGFGQSQTSLKVMYNSSGQTLADIRASEYTFAQSEAYIQIRQSGVAQSQTSTQATNRGFAQARVSIKATTAQNAQTQVNITSGQNANAQANTYIYLKDVVTFGQSQASILTTNYTIAQVQADILTTYNAHAFAQAFILKSRGQAQAQAYIKIHHHKHLVASDRVSLRIVGTDRSSTIEIATDLSITVKATDRNSLVVVASDRDISIKATDKQY